VGELDEVLALGWDGGAAAGPSQAGAVGVGHGHLGEGWLIGHAINGGVLMALGASAAASGLASVGHPDLLTWGAHFLSAAVAGPVEVRVEVLRVGRTVSTAEMRVVQRDEEGRAHERVRMTGTFGTLDRAEPVHRAPAPPQVPAPEDCLPATRDSSPCSIGSTPASTPRPRGSRWGVRVGAVCCGSGCGCATGASPMRPCCPTPLTR